MLDAPACPKCGAILVFCEAPEWYRCLNCGAWVIREALVAKKRAEEAEAQLEFEQKAHLQTRDYMQGELREVEAECAAMREALDGLLHDDFVPHLHPTECDGTDTCQCPWPVQVRTALSSTAGKALLERLARAEVAATGGADAEAASRHWQDVAGDLTRERDALRAEVECLHAYMGAIMIATTHAKIGEVVEAYLKKTEER